MRWGELQHQIRPFVGWKVTSIATTLLWGLGVSEVGVSDAPLRFAVGYVLFVLGGLWALACWLESDWLRKQKALLRKREIQRSDKRFREEKVKLFGIGISIGVLVVLVTAAFLTWTRATQVEARNAALKKDRDEVFDHLTVSPADLQTGVDGDGQVLVSIINNGHSNMGNHIVQCLVRSYLTMNNIRFVESTVKVQEFAKGLLGSGRGETVSCSTLMGLGGHSIACIGLDIGVNFALVDQPKEKMDKWYRYSYYYKRQTPWIQESFQDAAWDPCAKEPDIKESNENVPLHARLVISPKPDNKALPEPLNENRPLRLNFIYENDGNEAAKNYRMFDHSWIIAGNPESPAVQNQLWAQFNAYMRKTDKLHLVAHDLEPEISLWSTTEGQVITHKQIANIKAGTAHIFITIAMPFEDNRGTHVQEACMYIQTPADPESPWHPCGIHHSEIDRRH